MKTFEILGISVLAFIYISLISCSEYDDPIANFIGVVCKNGKAKIRFDAEPNVAWIETNHTVRETSITGYRKTGTWLPRRMNWEVVGNNVIIVCPKPLYEGWTDEYTTSEWIVGDTTVQWGTAPNEQSETFRCPCLQ